MSNTGTIYERKLRKLFEAHGFTVVRSAASQTPIDLIAWNERGVYFLQVKRCANAHVAAQARYAWRQEMKGQAFPGECPVQMWMWRDAAWHVYDWIDGALISKGEKTAP